MSEQVSIALWDEYKAARGLRLVSLTWPASAPCPIAEVMEEQRAPQQRVVERAPDTDRQESS